LTLVGIEGSMNLILLLLRLLLGPLAPSWNEGVPLAVRRDGRLQNRLHREAPPHHEPAKGPGSLALRGALVWMGLVGKGLLEGLVRAVGWVGRCWAARWQWPARQARGGS
jgi:hypothetical protein